MLVTTIIPTTAERQEIRRAVQSIRNASQDPVQIIAVINGSRGDPELCRWLELNVRVEYLSQPSLTAALLRGRQLVDTPFFSFLDDDDEYMPGTLDQRLQALEGGFDVAVTNGWRGSELVFDVSGVAEDPLAAVLTNVWLCNYNGLYRSQAVGAEYFVDIHKFAEWTWLAFRLALDGKRIVALDEPGFRVHDTPGSLSKSAAYRDAYPELFKRMLATNPPAHVAHLIRRRIGADLHDRSVRALERGARFEAFKAHLQSLVHPGGMRYLVYSRRLFRV